MNVLLASVGYRPPFASNQSWPIWVICSTLVHLAVCIPIAIAILIPILPIVHRADSGLLGQSGQPQLFAGHVSRRARKKKTFSIGEMHEWTRYDLRSLASVVKKQIREDVLDVFINHHLPL